mmetsp:Transcript_1635/g.3783  ORF Transcript_1635/g.3783 Transcript_1635/m.3783 type:complete len:290 (+) Transcript_1635:2646-3515(+)
MWRDIIQPKQPEDVRLRLARQRGAYNPDAVVAGAGVDDRGRELQVGQPEGVGVPVVRPGELPDARVRPVAERAVEPPRTCEVVDGEGPRLLRVHLDVEPARRPAAARRAAEPHPRRGFAPAGARLCCWEGDVAGEEALAPQLVEEGCQQPTRGDALRRDEHEEVDVAARRAPAPVAPHGVDGRGVLAVGEDLLEARLDLCESRLDLGARDPLLEIVEVLDARRLLLRKVRPLAGILEGAAPVVVPSARHRLSHAPNLAEQPLRRMPRVAATCLVPAEPPRRDDLVQFLP